MTTNVPWFDAHTHLLLTGPSDYPLAMRDADALLSLQRSHGIIRSTVYSPMEIQRALLAGDEPLVWARRYNDFIAKIQDAHRSEIVGVGVVYPFAGEDSAHEAERCVRQLGLHGVMANPYIGGAWLDQDDRAKPMLAMVEALGVPLIVHPEEQMERVASEALGRRLLFAEGLVLWRTLATTLVMYGFAAGPLLREFPRLRLVFAHGGGSFWGNATRIDVLFQELVSRGDPIVARQWQGGDPTGDPLRWLREHEVYMDCAWLDRGALQTAIDRIGADRLLFGTDGSAHPGSIHFFRSQLESLGLRDDDLNLIRFENASRIFRT